MKIRNIVLVGLTVSLLAVGCNSAKNTTTPTGTSATSPDKTPPLEQLLANNPGVPSGFVPYEGDGYRLLVPTTWSRRAGNTPNDFTLSNNSGLSIAQSGGLVMDLSLVSKSTQTNIKDVVATLVKGQQNVTKTVDGFTNSGIKFASVSYGPAKSLVALYVVELSKQSYMKILVSGATADPYVKAVVNSITLRSR